MYKVMTAKTAVLIAWHADKGEREMENKTEVDCMLLPVPYYFR